MKESLFYTLIRPLVYLFVKLFFSPTVIGKENIPKKGRIVLASNHTNNFDCILLMSLTKRNIHFLAKEELWHGKFSFIFKNLGLIPVNRQIKDKNVLRQADSYLLNDMVVGIFPEGTTEKEKKVLLPFKIGAVKMASDTKSKIIPMAISGTYKFRSPDLKIVVGKSLDVSTDLDKANLELQAAIKNLLEGE